MNKKVNLEAHCGPHFSLKKIENHKTIIYLKEEFLICDVI